MVGFKSIYLLLSLLFFAACVPQTKQTECKSNEAFNASLRTCVPVMNGPSSFITFDSYSPTSAITAYKGTGTPVTFSVVVSNPYAQTYSLVWERIYNGVPVAIAPTAPTYTLISPTTLASELGIHIISVKIKDANNNIVDSHSFQLKIDDNPKPVIASGSVEPSDYASTYTPSDLPVDFSFTVNNNGAAMSGAGYRVDWSVYRSGVPLPLGAETDNFPTVSPAGSLSGSGHNYPEYSFDPANIDGIEVGAYTIRARLTNNLSEVVAEQQWSVNVTHPNLSKVISRDIYTASTSPTFDTLIKAFNGVAHTGSTAYNFIPCSMVGSKCVPVAATQGDFCVAVASGEGTYAADSQYVRVDFYLDGGSMVYSGRTTAGDNKICLTDGGPSVLNTVLFSNSSASSVQGHTLVARVVDEATGQEYTAGDMNPSLGGYPVTWNFTVWPQNQAPTITFGTMSGLSCTTTVGGTKNNCSVSSDTNFTVKVLLADDDFYSLPANEADFDYSIRLYENGVNIQTCSKSDAGYTGATDTDGSDGYDCIFHIESYNGSGPINTMAKTYQIQAEIIDNGSPITSTDATSNSLTWNIPVGKVTEKETAPSIANWSVAGAVTEGASITFSAEITDAEMDNHTYIVEYCLDAGCSTFGTLASGPIVHTPNTNPHIFNLSIPLDQYFLHNFPALGCDDLLRNGTCSINFRLKVSDVNFTASPLSTTTGYGASTITNLNHPPSLNVALSTPAPSAASFVGAIAFVGLPISISNNPSTIITDASDAGVEKSVRYQWYVKNNTSVTTWQPIDGANGYNLIWTPSLIKSANLGTDNPVSLMLCIDDQPEAAVATPNTTNSVCSDATPWVVTVKNNVAVTHDLSTAPSSTELASNSAHNGKETAVWYETPSTFNNGTTSITSSAAYIAMFGNDEKIHIKKVLVRDNGDIDPIGASHVISFNAVPNGTIDSVKDLSITGTSNGSELYVAYLASRTGSPGSFYPQVRRIDMKTTPVKAAPNNHGGKFGFDYDGLAYTNNCAPTTECSATATSGITSLTFNPTAAITGNIILGTPNGDFTVTFGTYNGVNTICSNCSGSQMAIDLANIINNSTDALLAGYSASTSSNTITIYGATANDYFDASSHADMRIADQMGDIYIHAGNWYVPFINTTLGGAYNDKLSIYTGGTGAIINPVVVDLQEPYDLPGLALMDAAIKFDSYYDGTSLWVAMVSKTGSAGKLYKVNPATFLFTAATDEENLFSTDVVLDVNVAASSTYVYVIGRVSSGNKLKVGVYNYALSSTPAEFDIDDPAHIDPSLTTPISDDFFNSTSISSFKIIPYGSEARILAASRGTGVVYQLYMARLRQVSSTWTLSCGDCKQISELGQSVSGFTNIAAAPIRVKSLVPSMAAYRLGTDGSVTGQGIKDVAFVSYGRIDSAVVGSCDPALGVLNVEGEAIGATTTFSGSAPNQDAGLYRGPLVKN